MKRWFFPTLFSLSKIIGHQCLLVYKSSKQSFTGNANMAMGSDSIGIKLCFFAVFRQRFYDTTKKKTSVDYLVNIFVKVSKTYRETRGTQRSLKFYPWTLLSMWKEICDVNVLESISDYINNFLYIMQCSISLKLTYLLCPLRSSGGP